MKVQIDLCKMFGVKEGEEFYIDSHGMKYKIENNKLMAEFHNGWSESWNDISWLLREHEIEILKPKMPVKIAIALETYIRLGYTKLNYTYDWNQDEDCWYLYNQDELSAVILSKENKVAKWFEKFLSKGEHVIQDILNEFN